MKKTTTRRDVYEEVTAAVVEALQAGVKPWEKPWSGGNVPTHALRHNGMPYRGVNVLILWMAAAAKGYGSAFWMTYRQAAELGGQVRKGERSTVVVYYGATKIAEENQDGEEEERNIRFLKQFNVFNADQIEGLPAHYYAKPVPLAPAVERIAELEAFVAATGADIENRGTLACYSEALDAIRMPPIEAFKNAEYYYSTLCHELTHWTKHRSRLAREFGRKALDDEAYAREELVAELGSAFLGAEFGFAPGHIEDHAAYIASWLKVLENDKRAIFQAAAHAQRAVDFLLQLTGRGRVEEAAPSTAPEVRAA